MNRNPRLCWDRAAVKHVEQTRALYVPKRIRLEQTAAEMRQANIRVVHIRETMRAKFHSSNPT